MVQVSVKYLVDTDLVFYWVLAGAREMFGQGIASSLQPGNERSVREALGGSATAAVPPILVDPQTAGGLLFGLPEGQAEACLAELRQAGYTAAANIGRIANRNGAEALISMS